jgi:hypothetical protein
MKVDPPPHLPRTHETPEPPRRSRLPFRDYDTRGLPELRSSRCGAEAVDTSE